MMSHIDTIIIGCVISFFGLLGTGFLTLIWRRFDSIDRRFDSIDRRFDSIDRRFDSIDRRLDAIERRISIIETDLKQFYNVTGELKGRIDEISHRTK